MEVYFVLKNRDFFKRIVSARFGKAFIILLSAALMFGGPTYFLYALRRFISFPFLELLSILVFVVGLYLFLQVYEEK
jgi:hypothetical protein